MFPVCRDAKFWWEREGGNGDRAADKNGIIPKISLTVLTAILLGAYAGESWRGSWRRVRESCGLCLQGLFVDSKLSEFSASNPSSLLGPETDTQFNLKIPSPQTLSIPVRDRMAKQLKFVLESPGTISIPRQKKSFKSVLIKKENPSKSIGILGSVIHQR